MQNHQLKDAEGMLQRKGQENNQLIEHARVVLQQKDDETRQLQVAAMSNAITSNGGNEFLVKQNADIERLRSELLTSHQANVKIQQQRDFDNQKLRAGLTILQLELSNEKDKHKDMPLLTLQPSQQEREEEMKRLKIKHEQEISNLIGQQLQDRAAAEKRNALQRDKDFQEIQARTMQLEILEKAKISAQEKVERM